MSDLYDTFDDKCEVQVTVLGDPKSIGGLTFVLEFLDDDHAVRVDVPREVAKALNRRLTHYTQLGDEASKVGKEYPNEAAERP